VLAEKRYLAFKSVPVRINGDIFSHFMLMSVSARDIFTFVALHTSMRENVLTGSGAGQPRVKTINAYMAAPRS
jgi:hypothetical protein